MSAAPEAMSKTRLRLWLRLLGTTARIEAELRRRMREEHDTTLPRFDVMAALSRFPDGLRMSDLSGALRVSAGNVTGIVDRLCEDRLVERVAVPGDRRAQVARLTPAGRAAFARLAAAHEGWLDAMLSRLDGSEARALSALLARLDAREDAHAE